MSGEKGTDHVAVTASHVAPGRNPREIVIAQGLQRPARLDGGKSRHRLCKDCSITLGVHSGVVERHFAVFAEERILATGADHRWYILPDRPMLFAAFEHAHVPKRAGCIATQERPPFS